MDFLSVFLSSQIFTKFISPAANTDLASYLIVVAVVWKTMGKKVSKAFTKMQNEIFEHMRAIENSVGNVAGEMKLLKEAVTADLKTHSSRLTAVETGIMDIRKEVDSLKHTKENKNGSSGTPI